MRPLSSKVDSLDFVHVKNNDVLPENTLRVYNKFGETADYQEYSEGDKLEFIQKSSLPFFVGICLHIWVTSDTVFLKQLKTFSTSYFNNSVDYSNTALEQLGRETISLLTV